MRFQKIADVLGAPIRMETKDGRPLLVGGCVEKFAREGAFEFPFTLKVISAVLDVSSEGLLLRGPGNFGVAFASGPCGVLMYVLDLHLVPVTDTHRLWEMSKVETVEAALRLVRPGATRCYALVGSEWTEVELD